MVEISFSIREMDSFLHIRQKITGLQLLLYETCNRSADFICPCPDGAGKREGCVVNLKYMSDPFFLKVKKDTEAAWAVLEDIAYQNGITVMQIYRQQVPQVPAVVFVLFHVDVSLFNGSAAERSRSSLFIDYRTFVLKSQRFCMYK